MISMEDIMEIKKKKKDSVEYSIEIPRHDKYFFLVRKFLENILGVEKILEKEKEQIIMAVNEACDKLIRTNMGKFKDVKIAIKAKISLKKIVITLSHKGKTVLAGYLKDYNEEKVVVESVKSRIGDYLIETNADEVSFTSSKKKGHQVKIVKYRGRE